LLLGAVLIFLWLRYRRREYWSKLALATLWMIVGVLLPLAPWAARNAVSLGREQFLAPRYAETYGDVLPTGFYAWTKTWMFRFRDAYLFTWKLSSQPIDVKNLPSYAVDSPEELSRVASLLDRYNRAHGIPRSLDLEFAELARERVKRHPIRTYVWIPSSAPPQCGSLRGLRCCLFPAASGRWRKATTTIPPSLKSLSV